jgi:hypothetical protein
VPPPPPPPRTALGSNLRGLFCLGQNSAHGVAAFHFPCLTDRAWTKHEAAAALNASEDMLDSAQVYAGLLVLRKTPAALRFVREWLAWSLSRADVIADDYQKRNQHPGFVKHRHDQSLLSLLVKHHEIKTFPMPTRSHDVRDIWSWDAGYCDPSFDWPLPAWRDSTFYGYITHYKEMGHQRDSMSHCMQTQPALAGSRVPLADYVQSHQELAQMRLDLRLRRLVRSKRWTPAKMPRLPNQCDAVPLYVDLLPAACIANVSFGCVMFDGVPQLWTAPGCYGVVMRCAAAAWQTASSTPGRLLDAGGPVDLPCGRNREAITVCSCTRVNDVEALRHWVDGKERYLSRARAERVLRKRQAGRLSIGVQQRMPP